MSSGSSFRNILSAALLLASFLTVEARALTLGCVQFQVLELFGEKAGTGSRILDFTEYEDARSILFLSDGAGRSSDVSLGQQVAARFPSKQIVRTDFEVLRDGTDGNFRNLRTLQMDNTRKFPFEDDSFDLVVLRRGMCHCHDGIACAGFCPTHDSTKHFFSEVARVLNKANPDARARLHGAAGVEDSHIALWRSVGQEVEREQGVKIRIEMTEFGKFRLMTIRPAGAP